MSFRTRLTVASGVAVSVAVVLASVAIFLIARGLLRGQVDSDLRRLADDSVNTDTLGNVALTLPADPLGGSRGYGQLIGPNGLPTGPPPELMQGDRAVVPVSERAALVAAGKEAAFFDDLTIDGTHIRVFTQQVSTDPPLAVQVARPLDEVDQALRRLALLLTLVALCGVGLAVGLGRLVARTALAPVRRMTSTAEQVTLTGDLASRIEVSGKDEVARLAVSFNRMLEALDSSLSTQRQLVADASHELRTPLTSLRTNIEVLARGAHLSPVERSRLIQDVVGQLEELTELVSDLVELARGNEATEDEEDVRLDLLVAETIDRWQRHRPDWQFTADLHPCVVRGAPSRLERAVGNLLDNASKWSPKGTPIIVTVRDGEVCVEDRGPGIADSDRPYIFDRFYRSPAARGTPGSGLGLAIVKQVAESHGGSVSVEAGAHGGSRFRIRFLNAA